MIRVLHVDDSAPYRLLVRELLGFEAGVEVVGEAADAASAEAEAARLEPDVVLLDLDLGSDEPGLDVAARLAAVAPRARIVLVTGWPDDDGPLGAHVAARLGKTASGPQIAETVRRVNASGRTSE